MTPGSPFLKTLEQLTPNLAYELTCYSYLRDWWVGTQNTSPPGVGLHWVDPPTWPARLLSHFTICRSRPILVDVALRIKGLEPLSRRASVAPVCGPFTQTHAGVAAPSASHPPA